MLILALACLYFKQKDILLIIIIRQLIYPIINEPNVKTYTTLRVVCSVNLCINERTTPKKLMLLSLTISLLEQELLYKEYLDIAFPSQSLNKTQFHNLMKRLGFLDVTEHLDNFFR